MAAYTSVLCFVICHSLVVVLASNAASHLFEGDLGCEDDVGALSLVLWVLLVPENEGDVCRGVVGRLVSLPGEGDLGPGFPAFLHHHVEHLVFRPHAAPVGVEAAAGDLHVLGAAVHHLVKGHQQVVHHRLALQAPLASPQPALVAGEPTQVAEGEPSEGVEEVIFAITVVAKEDVEVVGAVEEGGEGGVGVAGEIIAESVALACQWHSIFKTWKPQKTKG